MKDIIRRQMGTRKNPSPRWDLNPRSSVISCGCSPHTTGDSVVGEGEMSVETSTASRRHMDNLTAGCG